MSLVDFIFFWGTVAGLGIYVCVEGILFFRNRRRRARRTFLDSRELYQQDKKQS